VSSLAPLDPNTTPMHFTAAQIALVVTTLLYFAMNGAQIFETAVLVPKWTASPPDSFALFRGPYAIDLKTFWIATHSVHEVSMLAAIVLCWKLDVRNALLCIFGLHFLVRVWTLSYFAPEIISFQRIAETGEVALDLVRRVTLWKWLNAVRVAAFVALSMGMLAVCARALRVQ
jgi:hypothetical protein